MKPSIALFAAIAALGVTSARADTRSSDQDKTTMEQKASPANPVKQDEEQAEAHGQPDSNTPSGRSAEGASSHSHKAKAKSKAVRKRTTGPSYPSNENKVDSTRSSAQ